MEVGTSASSLDVIENAQMAAKVDTIVLVPIGGLCNRLRAIISALALARDCHAALDIVWLRNQELNARYSDLFQALNLPAEESGITVRIVESTSWLCYGVARKRNLWLPSWYQRHAFDVRLTDDIISAILSAPHSDAELAAEIRHRLHGRVLIQTGSTFYPSEKHWLKQLFRPSAAVEGLLQQRLSMITPQTVGLHIRQTDNTQSILHSPLSAFEAAMRKDLERDPATTFYVATDNPSLLPVLSARFPIHYSTTAPTRTSVRGMQEALAELWTLMACPRFHGSYWSSFSDFVVEEGPDGDIVRG